MNPLEKLPLGLYEKALPLNLPWKEKLSCTKEAGYDFLEMSIDATPERLSRLEWGNREIRKIQTAMHDLGLPIRSLALTANRSYTLGNPNRAVREQGIAIIEKAITLASRLGIRLIQLPSYDVYETNGNADTRRSFMDSVKRCAELAAREAVILALETMDSEFVDTISKAQGIVRQVDSPYLQIYADVGNIAARGYNMVRELYDADNHVVAIHLKDTRMNVFRHVPFGEGIVDFNAVFATLLDIEYNGLLVAEMWCDGATTFFPRIKDANSFLRDLMRTEREAI